MQPAKARKGIHRRKVLKMRIDKRKYDELRPLEIKAGVIPNANGSAMVRMGKTIAVAAVYGPREMFPKFKQKSNKAVLNTLYTMVPFSTTERVRPGRSRRSMEICKVTRQALEPAIFLEEFPKSVIDVYINIIQADAGTRTAGINAASVALADAGIPMRDLVASVAGGKIGKNFLVDLCMEEEEETEADVPVAYMPRTRQITLLQMDGDLPKEDVKEIIKLAIKSIEKIYKEQRKALEARWKKG